MKTKLLITVLVSIVMVSVVCKGQKEDKELYFKTDTINLGTKRINQNIEAKFEFYNTTNKEIEIKAVVPSCGCTTAEISTKNMVIKPNENGYIRVRLIDKEVGRQEKHVRILANNKIYKLTIITYIIP